MTNQTYDQKVETIIKRIRRCFDNADVSDGYTKATWCIDGRKAITELGNVIKAHETDKEAEKLTDPMKACIAWLEDDSSDQSSPVSGEGI